jgi:mono/diheme cytochrome c family protein
MRTVVYTVLSVGLLGVIGGAAFVYSGTFNVAASEPHSGPVFRVLEMARIQSIKAHAAGIVAPKDLDDQARVVAATAHFAAHCATCHAGPGTKRDAFAAGMYPQPPDLTNVSKRYTPEQLFWILKNGIKMSGMPSMAEDGDDMLWSTVAFLEKLPTMSADDYNDLWMASQAQGGMGHMMDMGGMNMHGMTMTPAGNEQNPRSDEPASNTATQPDNTPPQKP